MRLAALLVAACLALATLAVPGYAQKSSPAASGTLAETRLPREARATLELIRKGGPYPYARDGALFANREGRLPHQPRGYYREFTVKTPGVRNRGARRIIWGSGGEYYYTDDHYNHFRRILE